MQENQQIKKLAELARVDISDNMMDGLTGSISDILSLMNQLQSVDTTGVEPMAHPMDITQRLRTDLVSEPDQRESLQGIAPAVEEGLFLVPKVID